MGGDGMTKEPSTTQVGIDVSRDMRAAAVAGEIRGAFLEESLGGPHGQSHSSGRGFGVPWISLPCATGQIDCRSRSRPPALPDTSNHLFLLTWLFDDFRVIARQSSWRLKR